MFYTQHRDKMPGKALTGILGKRILRKGAPIRKISALSCLVECVSDNVQVVSHKSPQFHETIGNAFIFIQRECCYRTLAVDPANVLAAMRHGLLPCNIKIFQVRESPECRRKLQSADLVTLKTQIF